MGETEKISIGDPTHPEVVADEIGEGSPTFLELGQRIKSGEGEMNSRVLERSFGDELITEGELGTLALALLKAIEPRADKAGIDDLTGLYNRLGFNEKLAQVVEELRFTPQDNRKNPFHSVMVVAADANSLKAVNDTYGHEAGNKFLITLANGFKESVKEGQDAIARDGGDEFLILMPIETDEEGIHERIIERIRVKISNLRVDVSQTVKLPISTAMGYAVLDKNNTEMTVEELLKAADDAMYANKKEMKAPAE